MSITCVVVNPLQLIAPPGGGGLVGGGLVGGGLVGGGLVVPDCVQLTLMLPLPSEVAVNDAAVQDRLAPIVGTGTANPAEATAAASTRLMERFMYMVYLEKRWRYATIAKSKPWAIYGKDVIGFTGLPVRHRHGGGTADQRFIWT